MVPGGSLRAVDFRRFGLTRDGSAAVYFADQEVDDLPELYTVLVGGGPARRLNDRVLGERVEQTFDVSNDTVAWVAAPGLFTSPIFTGPDSDRDGVLDACDGCTDGDGAGNACDCAPSERTERRPGDVERLVLRNRDESGETLLSWLPATGADSYAVTRGILEAVGPDHYGSCVAPQVVETTWADTALPSAGSAFTYLVQGVSADCGPGPLGYTSHAGARVNRDAGACLP
jgi:hypothetical protein